MRGRDGGKGGEMGSRKWANGWGSNSAVLPSILYLA